MGNIDTTCVNAIRALSADAVQKANSGHPGLPLGAAPIAYELWAHHMKHNGKNPNWANRDRFILSAGHGSAMLYSLLHLFGYGLTLDDLKNFRQDGSLTPGHPEYRHTKGVEATTGPLGAGMGMAVGMAIAEAHLAAIFNKPDFPIVDHYTFALGGDGCMMEGISSEVFSLAGTLALDKLIVLYDSNNISIEGGTDISFTEDPTARFEAYGWQVLDVDWTAGGEYHEDLDALHEAIVAARAETARPSLIRLRTIIAWPAPTMQGHASTHGAALGAEEVAGLKRALGLDPGASFQTDGVLERTRAHAAERAAAARADWDARYEAWRTANPGGAALLDRLSSGRAPEGLDAALPTWETGASVATRNASGAVLTALAPVVPELWGGSADLGGSNKTTMVGEPSFLPASLAQKEGDGPYGRVIHFGVREHAMGGVLNGIALDGLTRAYGGTFLVFADYMRPAVRLAALMGIGSLFVWSHDSIGVGEDGPTHQPIEHLASLRAIPGFDVVRPADANETAAAWAEMLRRRDEPAGIVLSRQNLPVLASAEAAGQGVRRGAYVLAEATDSRGEATAPAVTLIATGSEVSVAVDAREILQAAGTPARVVSAPCLEWFDAQDEDYRASVLPESSVRVSVEAGIAMGWRERVGDSGAIVSIDRFGASAPAADMFADYGFTGDNVASVAREALARA